MLFIFTLFHRWWCFYAHHFLILSRTIKAHSEWPFIILSRVCGVCVCVVSVAEAVGDAVGAGVWGETDGDSWEARLGRTHCNPVWPGTLHTHMLFMCGVGDVFFPQGLTGVSYQLCHIIDHDYCELMFNVSCHFSITSTSKQAYAARGGC